MRLPVVVLALTPGLRAASHLKSVESRDVGYPRVEQASARALTGEKRADNARAEQVKAAFLHSWTQYKARGLPQDEVKPVTGVPESTRNGWGASAVDALSTAIIMNLTEPVHDILKHIGTINYARSYTNDSVSLFETTIRYLGGMLSGYDLLQEEARKGMANAADLNMLLGQSVSLANALSIAFNTPSGMPYNDINPTLTGPSDPTFNINNATANLAQAGTLVLEWTRLADLTQNGTYRALVDRMQAQLMAARPYSPAAVAEAWPGLVGFDIYLSNGTYANGYGTWGGGADSYYEYLMKMWVYDAGPAHAAYKQRWIQAVNSSRLNLRSHPLPLRPGQSIPTPPTVLVPSSAPPPASFNTTPVAAWMQNWRETRARTNSSQHLACFAAGNILYGASVLDDAQIVEASGVALPPGRRASPGLWADFVLFGLELLEGCRHTYASTSTQIGPERWSWRASDASNAGPPYFTIERPPAYVLRPEVMESYYYAYRVTGLAKYQDWAWEAFQAIERHCRTRYGFSALRDVNVTGIGVGGSLPAELREGNMRDEQESFWFAETLKYAYLVLQDGDEPWHIPRGLRRSGKHRYVYNTEAHPLRVRGTPL